MAFRRDMLGPALALLFDEATGFTDVAARSCSSKEAFDAPL
jgi:hypothetical protein